MFPLLISMLGKKPRLCVFCFLACFSWAAVESTGALLEKSWLPDFSHMTNTGTYFSRRATVHYLATMYSAEIQLAKSLLSMCYSEKTPHLLNFYLLGLRNLAYLVFNPFMPVHENAIKKAQQQWSIKIFLCL